MVRASVRIAAAWLVVAAACRADVPTPEQACRDRNAALCEVNGVEFLQPGGCPEGMRTLRPAGAGDCTRARDAVRPVPTAAAAARPASRAAPEGGTDRSGVLPQWWLPAAVAGGWLGLVVLQLRSFLRRRESEAGSHSSAPRIPSLAQRLASAALGIFASSLAALSVYGSVVDHFHNTDTAAPVLIGFAAALVTFVVVLYPALLLSERLLSVLSTPAGSR